MIVFSSDIRIIEILHKYFTENLQRLRFPLTLQGRAASRFQKQRTAYYEYMASMLRATEGRLTLLDILREDGRRYGKHPRGILSRYWARRYEVSGGDLSHTWKGTLPDTEVLMIQVAQEAGAGALEQTLEDMSRVGAIIEEAKRNFVSTMATAAIGLAIAIGMVLSIPMFSAPMLRDVFSIPYEHWGPMGRLLFDIADFIAPLAPYLVAGTVAAAGWTAWSIRNLTGKWRMWADRHIFLYKLYRDLEGALFLAVMATLTRHRLNESITLRKALVRMMTAATPWMRWHISMILARIDDTGGMSPSIFETGLLDQETLFLLNDIYKVRGFDTALQKTGAETEKKIRTSVAKKAVALRWMLLLASIGIVLLVFILNFAVIWEMNDVLTNMISAR